LLRLRRDLPALARLDKDALEIVGFEDAIVIFVRRWSVSSHILAVLHFADQPSQLGLPIPAGCWQRKLDSTDPRWGGRGSQASDLLVSRGEVHMTLSPWAAVLYAETLPTKNSFDRGR
jgi:maltooligosyltrehalose trehalohydrolase